MSARQALAARGASAAVVLLGSGCAGSGWVTMRDFPVPRKLTFTLQKLMELDSDEA